MDLLALRTQFIILSGRHDLVEDTTDYVNNGADFFIQSGQRFLQSLLETFKSDAFILRVLATGANRISFTDCQAVKDVWLREASLLVSGDVTSGERYEIIARSVVDFTTVGASANTVGIRFTATSTGITLSSVDSVVKISFDDDEDASQLKNVERTSLVYGLSGNQDLSTSGLPYYYALDIIRNQEIEGTELLRGVVLGPPASQYYKVSIEGTFRPKTLSVNADINFWSENYPDTLLYATFYSMEAFYRNQTGKREWLDSIMQSIQGIDFDVVGESTVDTNQMRG